MATVLEIRELRFDGDCLVVDAVVEDMRLERRQTDLDPEEWGPGLCRGTLHFSDEVLIPATDADLMVMLGQNITDWTLIPNDEDYPDE